MRIILITFTLVTLLLAPAKDMFGQVVLAIDDVTLTESETAQAGSFEVGVLHGLSETPSIAGYQLVLSLFGALPSPQARFTGVSAPVDDPYPFAPSSLAPTGVISEDGATVHIGDFLLQNFADLENNSALARIHFEVEGGLKVGDEYLVEISVAPDDSFLATGLTGRVPFSVNNGRIVVANAIPEPSSAMFLMGLGSLMTTCTRRRKKLNALIQ